MSLQELSGAVMSVGDFVKFPNPSAAAPGAANAFLHGVYCGQNGQYAVVNVPLTTGSNTMYRSVLPSTCVTLISVNGPANSVSNK